MVGFGPGRDGSSGTTPPGRCAGGLSEGTTLRTRRPSWVSLEETELTATISNVVLAPKADSLAEGEGAAGRDDLSE
jgi:hypothetical protein